MEGNLSQALLNIQREYALVAHAAQSGDLPGITLLPASSPFEFTGLACVFAPDSPWFGGVFEFTVTLSAQFPYECPIVRFASPLGHPMLRDGHILSVTERFVRIEDPEHQSVLLECLRTICDMWLVPSSALQEELVQRGKIDSQHLSANSFTTLDGERSCTKWLDSTYGCLLADAHGPWITERYNSSMSSERAPKSPQRSASLFDGWLGHRLVRYFLPQVHASSSE